jgi:RimJ/RimL family protein N-acetyltransferase
MGADFVIRAAVEADVPAVAQIHVDDWRWAYQGLVPEGLLDSLSVARREEMWARGLARRRPGWELFVADRNGTVIGFVGCGPALDDDADEHTGEVYAIYLRPDVVGTGVGRALLSRAMDHLREAGFRRATLWVLADNVRTRRFYEIAGWSPDGTEKTEDWNGFPLLEARYQIELTG